MNDADGIQVKAAGIEWGRQWIVYNVSLGIVPRIWRLDTAYGVDDPDVSDLVDIDPGTVFQLIKVERCAVCGPVFPGKIIDLGCIDLSECRYLGNGLGQGY